MAPGLEAGSPSPPCVGLVGLCLGSIRLDFVGFHCLKFAPTREGCSAYVQKERVLQSKEERMRILTGFIGSRFIAQPFPLKLINQSDRSFSIGNFHFPKTPYARPGIILLVLHEHPLPLAIRLNWIAHLPDPLKYPLFLRYLWRTSSRTSTSTDFECNLMFSTSRPMSISCRTNKTKAGRV